MPVKPYTIGVKLSSGTANEGYIHFTNTRTNERVNVKTSNYEAITNLGDKNKFPTEYQNEDTISIEVSGSRTGSAVYTVNTTSLVKDRSFKITCVDVSTTNAPAVNIG